MARKNLLSGLMGDQTAAPGTPGAAPAPAGATPPAAPAPAPIEMAVDPERPRYAKGAIGAISRSVADLQARALVELDPFSIDAAGIQDRLETDAAEDDALRESIKTYGQQVPVLVRPHPEKPNRYQIVYGRRRVIALRDLNLPVKALIRQLDDRDLVIAQGQENTARRDLSFIEKASFARQMVDAGFDRKIIGDTLSMDKSLISRMLSVTDRLARDLIEAIGSAPSVGRDRWMALADAIEDGDHDPGIVIAMVNLSAATNSDERFEAALDYAKGKLRPKMPSTPLREIRAESGMLLAEATQKGGRMNLKFSKSVDRKFEDWLSNELPALYQKWRTDQ